MPKLHTVHKTRNRAQREAKDFRALAARMEAEGQNIVAATTSKNKKQEEKNHRQIRETTSTRARMQTWRKPRPRRARMCVCLSTAHTSACLCRHRRGAVCGGGNRQTDASMLGVWEINITNTKRCGIWCCIQTTRRGE